MPLNYVIYFHDRFNVLKRRRALWNQHYTDICYIFIVN